MSISDLHQVSVVHTAYDEVLANLILALVQSGTLPPAVAAEAIRRGKDMLATYPADECPLIEAAHTGLERLALQMEEEGPTD